MIQSIAILGGSSDSDGERASVPRTRVHQCVAAVAPKQGWFADNNKRAPQTTLWYHEKCRDYSVVKFKFVVVLVNIYMHQHYLFFVLQQLIKLGSQVLKK